MLSREGPNTQSSAARWPAGYLNFGVRSLDCALSGHDDRHLCQSGDVSPHSKNTSSSEPRRGVRSSGCRPLKIVRYMEPCALLVAQHAYEGKEGRISPTVCSGLGNRRVKI